MGTFKVYTFYKADGTKMLLYGNDPMDALDNGEYNLEYITENIRDYRPGADDSLEFINGKWCPKYVPAIVKLTMNQYEYNKN